MDDLISRQAAIDAIESLGWYHQNRNKDMVSGANSREDQPWYKSQDVYDALEKLPSVQPRTGKWINHLDDDGHHIADCSECGHSIQWFDDEDEPKFCCLCGSYNGGERK